MHLLEPRKNVETMIFFLSANFYTVYILEEDLNIVIYPQSRYNESAAHITDATITLSLNRIYTQRIDKNSKPLAYVVCLSELKSDNLQYSTLVRWVAGTIVSLTKCLIFQELFFS